MRRSRRSRQNTPSVRPEIDLGPLDEPDRSGSMVEVDRIWLYEAKNRLAFAAAFEAEALRRGQCDPSVLLEARGSAALSRALSDLLLEDPDSLKARDELVRVEGGYAVRTNAPGRDDDGKVSLVNGDIASRSAHQGPTTHDVYLDPSGAGGPGDQPAPLSEEQRA